VSDIGDAIKARMQAIADALDVSVLDPVTDAARAPVTAAEVDGILTRYGFGSELPKTTYPAGYPIALPGIFAGFKKDPGVAYRVDTFLDIFLRSIDAELHALVGHGKAWFEWNGTDLSQFDAKISGSQVASSVVAFTSFAGRNWIRISSTASGTPSGDISTLTVLPITQAPPSANYIVLADCFNIIPAVSVTGAYVLARYTSHNAAYFVRHSQSSTPVREGGEINAAETATVKHTKDDSAIVMPVNTGFRLEIAAEGSSIIRFFNDAIYADVGSPHTAAGKAAIGSSPGSVASSSVSNYFRNIRCYSL
jgi:hypothetical protein